ncbi:hypothetical protein [Nocardia wallacei]|uniref:hypothetical protein n=1 Tax=Nocardia wallacei TaxID=480035 RepID=UPI002454D7B3|nr:hypothetical protein [Nocardia wallacei]
MRRQGIVLTGVRSRRRRKYLVASGSLPGLFDSKKGRASMGGAVVVETIVIHTVRGDLEVLTGFAAAWVTEGYRAVEPWSAGESLWALSVWRSVGTDRGRTVIEADCARLGIVYVRQDIEHVMRDTAAHDDLGAIKPGVQLTGSSYVPMICKSTGQRGRALFMEPDRCNHGITICRECAESWDLDHTVQYPNTEGGRTLFSQLGAPRLSSP